MCAQRDHLARMVADELSSKPDARERLKIHARDELGIDYTRSNVFEIVDGHLTGRMVDQSWGDICDGEEKRKMLLATCAQLGISPQQAIAMGDGANDLPMMGEAGLSVAFRAKPVVRAKATCAFMHCGLDGLLNLYE